MDITLTIWLRLGSLGLSLLAAGPLAAQTLVNNGATIFVNTGGRLTVNGDLSQTGAALLRTAGTATVRGNMTSAAAAQRASRTIPLHFTRIYSV